MLSTASFESSESSLAKVRLLVSPVRSRRLEARFRSPMTTVRFRAAIMESLFPTCLYVVDWQLLRPLNLEGRMSPAFRPRRPFGETLVSAG